MTDHTIVPDRFAGKVAIVTGGTAGIGMETARQLGLEGAKALITGLPKDGDAAKGELESAGVEVYCMLGDMGDEAFCVDVVETAVQRWGGVDCLLNNAFSFLAEGVNATREDYVHSYNVGPIAFSRMIQLCRPSMATRGGGAVVNVSSISGFVAQTGRWTYNTAKGAVNQLTRCAALDLGADGIRVNSISPGWIWTREVDKAADYDRAKWEPVWGSYHMLQRLGHPIECARAALFLLSNDASFITGTDLPVDGGYQSMGPEGLGQTAKVAGSK